MGRMRSDLGLAVKTERAMLGFAMDEEKQKNDEAYAENFTLRGVLGVGGIGRVYVAFEKNLGREVAIKELIGERLGASRSRTIARFVREARVSGQLQHPGIVPLYQFCEKADGTFFYVMKRVQGKTLLQAINDCAEGRPEACHRKRLALLDSLIAVSEAMGYAHARGIVHRDLKPSNIILGEYGETVIIDWGLAKRLDDADPDTGSATGDAAEQEVLPAEEDEHSIKTRVGTRLGTPPYMAPEQIDSRFGTVDPSSDVYALGSILYLILTGERPYRGKGEEVMKQIASDALSPSPRAGRSFVAPELAAICEKAMAKAKDARFANAALFAQELKAFRAGRLVGVYAYSRMELFRRFVARNKAPIVAVVAIFLSVIGGGIFSAHFAFEAEQARARAEQALVDVTRYSDEAGELAEKTVVHFDQFFQTFLDDLQALASAESTRDKAELAAFVKAHPGVAGVVLTQDGTMLAVPDGLLMRAPLPQAGISSITIERAHGGVVVTDAYPAPTGGEHLFAMRVPALGRGAGELSAILVLEEVFPAAFDFDPKKSPYQVWCMDTDGTIIYDEDESQIGKILFTDAMYADYPELRALGERIQSKDWGVGTYRFLGRDGEKTIHKIAAWDKLTPAPGIEWKLVVSLPYEEK